MSLSGYLKPVCGLVIVGMLLVNGFQVAKGFTALLTTRLFPTSAAGARAPSSVIPPSPTHIESRLAGVTPSIAAPKPASIVVSPCQELSASIVTESSDPTWSSAVLRTATDARGRSRRVGDIVAGWKLELIGYNARASTPALWFSKGQQVCRLDLFAQGAVPVASGSATPPAARKGPREMEGRVRQVSERELQVDRSVVDWILQDPSALMKDVRVMPERRDGISVGLRLVRLGASGILPTLGLRQGDVIRGVNGFNLANPEQALEAYARLRAAPRLEVRLLRDGREMVLDYDIR